MKNLISVCFVICLSATEAAAATRVLVCDLTKIGSQSVSDEDRSPWVFQVKNGWWSKSIKYRRDGVWLPWCSGSGITLKITPDSGLCYHDNTLSYVLDLETDSFKTLAPAPIPNWHFKCRDK